MGRIRLDLPGALYERNPKTGSWLAAATVVRTWRITPLLYSVFKFRIRRSACLLARYSLMALLMDSLE
jgi:hypothetical protein